MDFLRIHRPLASWLFPSSDSAPPPLLDASVFERSYSLRVSYCISVAEKGLSVNQAAQMLFVPAAGLDGALVGYTFCIFYAGMMGASSVELQQDRFFFDSRSGRFFAVFKQEAAGTYNISNFDFTSEGSVQRNYFVVPAAEYSADHVPDILIFSKISFDTHDFSPDTRSRPHNPSGTTPAPNTDDVNGATEAVVPSFPSDPSEAEFGDSIGEFFNMLEPTASENETPTEPGMQNDARNLAALNAPRFSAYSTGPFGKQRISSLLAQFRADISGEFHGHRVKADRFDPYSGELLARRTGRTFISVVDTPRAEMTVLPTAALQLYFGNRMPPTADSSHLSSIPADTLACRGGFMGAGAQARESARSGLCAPAGGSCGCSRTSARHVAVYLVDTGGYTDAGCPVFASCSDQPASAASTVERTAGCEPQGEE